MAGGERLTESELASRASTTIARIRDLAALGILRPDADGAFVPADAQRVQIAAAYERGGIEVSLLGQAIQAGRMSFEFTDRIYPEASPPSGRTIGDLATELGAASDILPDLYLALGLPRPTLDHPLSEADEQALRAFIGAWTAWPLASDAVIRAARLVGDASRRIAGGWVELFVEAIDMPHTRESGLTIEELRPRMFEPAIRIAQVLEPTALWLLRQHLEQALNVANLEAMEHSLELAGIRPRTDRDPPAVVFADLSGFTRLTEEHGDALAVRYAEALAHLAVGVAATRNGRLVKQLGDGVMLAFDRARDAVEAALELRRAAVAAGLPPLHVGVSAGPVVERDGDYYGRTVNLASRLSGVAGPHEVVLNEAAAAPLAPEWVTALPPAVVKGLDAPIAVYRLERD